MTKPIDAINAYQNVMKQTTNPASEGAPSGMPSFGDLIKESVGSAIQAQHKSEQMSAKALVGKADMTEVLQAVTDAELALNTVMAIRDKVINAYEQVMRTPV